MSPSPLCRTQVTMAQVKTNILSFPFKKLQRRIPACLPIGSLLTSLQPAPWSSSQPVLSPSTAKEPTTININAISCTKDEQKDDSFLVRNLTCSFTVTAPTGRFISIYFRYFGIIPSPNCSASHVEVNIWPICFNYTPHIRFTTVPVKPLRC